MDTIISYIIEFLLKEQPEYRKYIGYTRDYTEFKNYKIVIIPSDFFEEKTYATPTSLPQLPLSDFKGTPLLFGKPIVEKKEETLVVHADLIASTYFLISRYEEIIPRKNNKDKHGRFIGKKSLPYLGGFIHRPIVDEYGKILRDLLQTAGLKIEESPKRFSNIVFTHDVDKIEQFQNLKGFLGGIYRNLLKLRIKQCFEISLIYFFKQINKDPLYTFHWLFAQNKKVKNSQTITFFKASRSNIKEDQPCYTLSSFSVKKLFTLCEENNSAIGLHASYNSGENRAEILKEVDNLSQASNKKITSNRHHYLRSLSPEDMEMLLKANITEDYTMGYADVAGFRLGTSRVVKFINPTTKTLTNLNLHPLTIMECSLDRKGYMNLTYEEALRYCLQLISEVKKHNGELVLLWHNTSVALTDTTYQRKLYEKIISHLSETIVQ